MEAVKAEAEKDLAKADEDEAKATKDAKTDDAGVRRRRRAAPEAAAGQARRDKTAAETPRIASPPRRRSTPAGCMAWRGGTAKVKGRRHGDAGGHR